ncbi:hypothetical protein [Clostridium sp. UBA4395]|uniref:hypothetical protein n=1 Tax=Clostridium TaxID=1485 RepID=UPI003217AF9A
MEYILIILILWVIYNITVYIPEKIKNHEERMLQHFQEINLRMNKLEEMIKKQNNNI